METMERKKPRPRRSFTPEFKADIVERCRAGDRSIGQVAKDFDLTETAVRSWVNQAETDAGERPGLTTEEKEELTRLRRENRLSAYNYWCRSPYGLMCPSQVRADVSVNDGSIHQLISD